MNKFRVGVLVTVLLAFLLVGAALTNRAVAGEVEADVIDQTFDEWVEDESTTDDIIEVWEDTERSSDCEKFATVAAFVALTFDELTVTPQEELVAKDVVTAHAADLLWNDYQPLYNNCLNEE